MKEIKNIKVRSDMYYDTKFKIIDTKPLRDTIHYVWMRILTLAAIVNKDGELYMSENIPYTIETLALEFNRDAEAVKMALEVLMELEMVILNKHNVYIVKNFMKHQKIKSRKDESKKNETNDLSAKDIGKSNEINTDALEKKEKEKNEILDTSNVKNSNEEDKALIVFNNGNNKKPEQKTSKKKNISQRKTRNNNNLKGRQKNEIISMEDEKDEEMAIFWDDPRYAEGGELVKNWTF